MGWATNLFCNITFSRETFNFKTEVENKLEEVNRLINGFELDINNFAIMTEPNKLFNNNDDGDMFYIIKLEVESKLRELEELYVKRYKLELLLNNWDNCHNNGLAIIPPENIEYDTAYIDGDFIITEETNKKENKENRQNENS